METILRPTGGPERGGKGGVGGQAKGGTRGPVRDPGPRAPSTGPEYYAAVGAGSKAQCQRLDGSSLHRAVVASALRRLRIRRGPFKRFSRVLIDWSSLCAPVSGILRFFSSPSTVV
jgi:hypothetical protein